MDEALIREQEQQLQKTGKYYKHICWMAVPPLCMACYLYGLRPLLLCGVALLVGNLCDRLISLLRRPQLTYADLAPFDPDRPDLPADVAEQVEISVKYEGYIQRQQKQVEDFRRMESHKLPPDLDYGSIQGLRLEAREKLNAVRPLDLGQASRISGVSPADVTALMIYLER